MASRNHMRGAIAVGVVATILAGCADDGPVGPDRTPAVIFHLAKDVTSNQYVVFRNKTRELKIKAELICGTKEQVAVDNARAAWGVARRPWKRSEIVQFGALAEDGFADALDGPVDEEAMEALIADDSIDLKDLNLDDDLRGMAAVEYLLWVPGFDTLASLVGRRCDMLEIVAEDLEVTSEDLRFTWESSWESHLSNPATSPGPYNSNQEIVDEWVRHMISTLAAIREVKLGVPLGDANGGSPQTELLESKYSERSLDDALDTLDGVRRVWDGVDEGAGIRELVPLEVQEVIDPLFDAAVAELTDVPDPLVVSILLVPEQVKAAQDALLALEQGISGDLVTALGVAAEAMNAEDTDATTE